MKSIGATSAGTEAGTTSFTMPCDELAALQLGFSYGGQIFSWDTEDLNLGEVQAGVCMLGVMADESVSTIAIALFIVIDYLSRSSRALKAPRLVSMVILC